MANWKVFREKIELMPHPNAERLELARVGNYQLVVGKDQYKDGDVVVLIPDKSILPDMEEFASFKPYLAGPDKNRVRAQKMRGELSCGILIPDKNELQEFPLGEDISAQLGIKEYIPEVPAGLQGRVKPVGNIDTGGHRLSQHDVEQFAIFKNELQLLDNIVVTEKLHGSLLALIHTVDNKILISSKGLLKRYLTLDEDETNLYWQAAHSTGLIRHVNEKYEKQHVQIFGEALPCQKGFSYGFKKPTMRIFRVEVNGVNLSPSDTDLFFYSLWVPILYMGPYNENRLRELKEGMETLSGKSLHIKEGIVVSTNPPTKSDKGGFDLYLKLLNSKYKENEETFN